MQVIFTQPPTPVKCGGAPQKIMYLTDSYLRKTGIRDQVDVSFVIPSTKIFSASDYYNGPLNKIATGRGIKIEYNMELVEVKPESGEAIFKNV
jgi:sulfide:quinone oxidoreductase